MHAYPSLTKMLSRKPLALDRGEVQTHKKEDAGCCTMITNDDAQEDAQYDQVQACFASFILKLKKIFTK